MIVFLFSTSKFLAHTLRTAVRGACCGKGSSSCFWQEKRQKRYGTPRAPVVSEAEPSHGSN